RRGPACGVEVLERDRDAFAVRVLDERQVRVRLAVALVDRGAVGGTELGRRGLASRQDAGSVFGREAQRVGHPAGTRKRSPLRSGAFASASSGVREGRGSSSRQTLTRSSG